MMDKKKLSDGIAKALEDKGKKKFLQSAELIVNFMGVDFSKSENRLNLDIVLPKGKGGKEFKCAVIGEADLADKARRAGADLIIGPNDLPSYTGKEKLKDLADNYILLAEPKLMSLVAKNFGQYLGKKGKLPRPITGDVAGLIARSKNSVRVATRGKCLPTVQALIGTEAMPAEDLQENAEAVLDAIKAKIVESSFRSVFVKLTMGRPVRVI